MNCSPSLGMYVSICLISSIAAILFSLTFRFFLDTNYDAKNCSEERALSLVKSIKKPISIDFRTLRICPNSEYELIIKSLYQSSYDKNCTRSKPPQRKDSHQKVPANDNFIKAASTLKENGSEIMTRLLNEGRENSKVNRVKKSISIAGHILGVMLIGSVVAALVEVLRIRLFKIKETSTNGHTSSRRCSLADWAPRRQSRKEAIQTQRSFEIQGMHRSPLRLLGARPPPLIRRSSFPAQGVARKDSNHVAVIGGTPLSRPIRRPSIDSDDETNAMVADFRHREHFQHVLMDAVEDFHESTRFSSFNLR